MSDLELMRSLRTLRRTVLMLQTELRNDHVDEGLIADIDQQLANGIATDARCEGLRACVDALRESTLTPRAALYRDTIRACVELTDAIEEVTSKLG